MDKRVRERLSSRFLSWAARLLPQEEQGVVLGDLLEEGAGWLASLKAVLGYALLRGLEPWRRMDRWLALLAVVAPCAVMLGSVSLSMADENAIYLWFFANNWDMRLLHEPGFWAGLGETLPRMLWSALALCCWSWCCGVLIRVVSRRAVGANCAFLCLFFVAMWLGWRPPTVDMQRLGLARDYFGNAAVFVHGFYRMLFAPLVQALFVMLPLWGGLRGKRLPMQSTGWAPGVFWVLIGVTVASLAAQASLWWQMRTWNNLPVLSPHLPSVLPLAFTGCAAYLFSACWWKLRIWRGGRGVEQRNVAIR
jgi:hypothetical protein